ncbi:MAG: SAM-dependent methyltransferase [Anaerolineales bacterium]|nr:SAM-dependent methyltransferase [Anaerolineales bacterium]
MMENEVTAPEEKGVLLEENCRLSESLIWGFQRVAYQANGIENWRQGTLPYYVTCNPFIAAAYARVVFAFFRDCYELMRAPGADSAGLRADQPIYIVELGSGTGRFAHFFLREFARLHDHSRLKTIPYRYVMTDFTAANISYWRDHEQLQPFIEAGVLDFASFDVEKDRVLQLQLSGQTLTPEQAANPIAVIANYVFDSVPQDLFRIENGKLYERLSTIHSSQPEPDLTDPELISRIEISYHNELVEHGPYASDSFNQVLHEYQARLANTDLLFPTLALQCLERWRQLANGRLLLLTGDKGYSREEDLLYLEEPYIATHGPVFSMMVNYHAFGRYVALQEGQTFHPRLRHISLNISAFLLGFSAEEAVETRAAYSSAIDEMSPDDFFLLVTSLQENGTVLPPETALALIRLSQWDSEVLLRNLPAFLETIADAPEPFKEELYWAICQVWDNYYPIGEEWDLAFYIGMLLYQMRYFHQALTFLGRSLQLYGENATTFHNMALCHYGLHEKDESLRYVEKALALDPEFDAAKGLRLKLQTEQARFRR